MKRSIWRSARGSITCLLKILIGKSFCPHSRQPKERRICAVLLDERDHHFHFWRGHGCPLNGTVFHELIYVVVAYASQVLNVFEERKSARPLFNFLFRSSQFTFTFHVIIHRPAYMNKFQVVGFRFRVAKSTNKIKKRDIPDVIFGAFIIVCVNAERDARRQQWMQNICVLMIPRKAGRISNAPFIFGVLPTSFFIRKAQ